MLQEIKEAKAIGNPYQLSANEAEKQLQRAVQNFIQTKESLQLLWRQQLL